MIIINLDNSESIELIDGDDTNKSNLKITMMSGKVYDNYYNNIDDAKNHYDKVKSGIRLFLENK